MSIATQIDPQTITARAVELPSEADLRELLDAAQVGLFVVQNELIRFATPALCQLVGWPLENLLGRPHGLLVTPEHRERTRAVVQTGRPGEFRCLRRDGTSFDARAQAVAVNFDAQPAVLVTLTDVSDFTHAVRQAHWNGGMLDRTESLCRSGSFEIEMPTGRLEFRNYCRFFCSIIWQSKP